MSEIQVGADAPVANAPAANAVPTPDAPTGQEQVTEESVKPPKTYSEDEHRKGISERLTKERRRLERTLRAELRAEMLEQQLQEARNPQPQQQRQSSGEPRQEDFKDYEDFLIAKAEHRLEQKLAKQRETQESDTKTQREEREAAERARRIQENVVSKGKAKYKDFEDVAFDDDLQISGPMARAIEESDIGHEVWYHLGSNPAEAERIAQMLPTKQVREIAKIEAQLTAPPKPTNAPAPIKPAGGQAAASKDWGAMSTAEHVEAWRNRKNR